MSMLQESFASCSSRCHPQHHAIWPRCHPHVNLNTRNRRVGRVFAAQDESDILSKAVQGLLERLVAEDHIQRDLVWQDTPGVGREKLLGGMQRFRSIYPDIAFRVLDASACPSNDKVFVHWTMTGTFEGELASSSGVSLLRFEDGHCRDKRVPPGLACRGTISTAVKASGASGEGILLENRTSESPDNP